MMISMFFSAATFLLRSFPPNSDSYILSQEITIQIHGLQVLYGNMLGHFTAALRTILGVSQEPFITDRTASADAKCIAL